ncbi:MAG: S-layer homology domain-containing protein [Oscillospiraceae bacterium]
MYEITATENANVTINYVAGTGGKVSPTSESVAPATGTAAGSTATPDAGYHFVNWTCNGTQVSINAKYVPGKNASGVYETATYTANFAPNTNTAYTVKHYKQNLDGTYPYTPTETDNLTGTTGELTKATAKTYTGFTAQSFSQQTIAGDGKTVVEIFYARNTYTVTYDLNGGSTTSPKTSFTGVKYGADTPTINNPTKEGYTFVGWDKEIARTVTASITYTAQWEVDNWKDNPDGPDSETGGDGIPDKYQALIKYQSADSSKGTVSPTVQVETLTKDNTGKYTGNVTVASTATATADKVAFDYWLAPNGTTKSYAAALSGSLSVSGGQTYTYTAYFDTDNNEDGTPDKYQVFVNFVPADSNGTVTGDGIKQVYTFENHATSGDVTPTLTGVTVKANDGYAFDVWTKDSGAEAVNPETKLTNVAGGTTITFKANFAKDEIGPDDGGDGIPDKYQVLINYVSASESQGAVDPAKEVVTLYAKDSASGKWVRIDDAAAAGSTAAAKSGYKFVKWTNEDGTTVSTEAKYVPSVKEAQGGETYTFTAHFASAHVPSTPKLEKGTHFNYVMGYSDGTIRPNNEITRAEIAIIFFRLLTDESRDAYYSEHNDFTDVAETSKSNIAISTLTNAGILTGYNDGTFRPNAKVTRGQLAAIIARFADMKGSVDKTFTDIDGHWAKDLILLAASNGWIDGYSDGTFRPAQNITRAQTMAIINRALDRQVSDVNDLVDDMNVWVDNMDPTAWYYFHVQEATNYHEYNRKAGTLDEIWTKKLPDIDWSVYQY